MYRATCCIGHTYFRRCRSISFLFYTTTISPAGSVPVPVLLQLLHNWNTRCPARLYFVTPPTRAPSHPFCFHCAALLRGPSPHLASHTATSRRMRRNVCLSTYNSTLPLPHPSSYPALSLLFSFPCEHLCARSTSCTTLVAARLAILRYTAAPAPTSTAQYAFHLCSHAPLCNPGYAPRLTHTLRFSSTNVARLLTI